MNAAEDEFFNFQVRWSKDGIQTETKSRTMNCMVLNNFVKHPNISFSSSLQYVLEHTEGAEVHQLNLFLEMIPAQCFSL